MPAPARDNGKATASTDMNCAKAVLELSVAGHSGALPQVCGLLARRAFRVEAMLCLPASGGRQSIWLLVPEGGRLEQLMRQIGKLGDVLGVDRRDGLGPFAAFMAT